MVKDIISCWRRGENKNKRQKGKPNFLFRKIKWPYVILISLAISALILLLEVLAI
jgi:hypothetical protein